MSEQRARTLIKKYLADQCTEAERRLVEQYFNETLRASRAIPSLKRIEKADLRMLQVLKKHVLGRNTSRARQFRRWVPYAAALILLGGAAVYMYQISIRQVPIYDIALMDVPPGGNRAKLTLADGQAIDLREDQRGIVVGDESITYADGAVLETLSNEVVDQQTATVLELSTPKGGTYQVALADGTQVWLNAASTLRYPARFGNDSRIVEVSGEAFFHVADDPKRPFRVISNGQEIEVLGTQFNLSAYADEPQTSTTLVEGKVRLSLEQNKHIYLTPGEQALVVSGELKKHRVHPDQYIVWKDGWVIFQDKTFDQIMREVERWYDVDVRYEGAIPSEVGYGMAKRTENLSVVLKLLESGGIRFRLDNRTLTILN